jgi:hypothetical protein
MNSQSSRLICQHARTAAGACLDCGCTIAPMCPACGAGVSPAAAQGTLPYCEVCGWPWIFSELEQP